MSATCEACGAEVLEIDVKCGACGAPLTSTGAHRLVGSVVLGQYEIVDVLGQGGMSVVYKGRHRLTEQEVALKVLPPELAAHSQVKSRFLEEARALAQLDHANIVHLYNFGQENGCFVLAMQFVPGRTFERMILEHERLDWVIAAHVACDVLRALEYAHGRGIIHRDMKPSNILVRDEDGAATVMDFGIAKMTTSTKLTATGQTMGTVRYMSPEQVRGQEVDARTDIYSLGATLYEAIVGDTPFDGETHFEIMTKHLGELPVPPSAHGVVVPAAFEAALMRAMAKKPDDRFPSAREFRREIEQAMAAADVGTADTMRMSRELLQKSKRSPAAVTTPPPPGVPGRPRLPDDKLTSLAGKLEPTSASDALRGDRARRKPRLWIGLGIVVVLASAGVALVVARSNRDRDDGPPKVAVVPDAGKPAPPARWPEAFTPPGMAFAENADFADDSLRVRAVSGFAAADVRGAYQRGFARFAQLLADRKLATDVESPPLSIVVVPKNVLCDERIYEQGEMPDRCAEEEIYYRVREKTLLVVANPARLDTNVAYGVALAVCLQSSIADCDAAIGDFERVLASGE
jgi:serine/threonine protein kinase